jgi:hypothetical protein
MVTGLSTSRSYTENNEVFAPMPTAMARTATIEKPGLFRSRERHGRSWT